MTLTNFPGGITSMGVPVNQIRPFGNHWFVDSTNGNDGNSGRNRDRAFETVTRAFAKVGDYDTIHLAGGGYTGNFTTPVDATAKFVDVRGFPMGEQGFSTWMAATVTSSPIITLRARGWRFTDIEFDNPATSAGIQLLKSADGSTHRPDFMTVDRCLFTGGQYGIEVFGGSTYGVVRNSRFDSITGGTGFAIHVTSTLFHIPIYWTVEGNYFFQNENHIGPADATYGFNDSVFRGNIFQKDSTQDATAILDIRASGGKGNIVVDNYFDIAKASFTADTTVRGNATDFAAGNHFLDGEQQEAMNVS